jgi:hypothetical protein
MLDLELVTVGEKEEETWRGIHRRKQFARFYVQRRSEV